MAEKGLDWNNNGADAVEGVQRPEIGRENKAQRRRLLDEEQQFTAVLPEELWLEILDYVNDAEGITNASNVSPYLRHLLRDKLMSVQIPGVLEKLLEDRSHQNPDPCIMPNGVLMPMRQVCKSWKEAVDNVLVRDIKREAYAFPAYMWPTRTGFNFRIGGQNEVSKAERFLKKFADTHQPQRANPFCSRSVSISHSSFDLGNADNEERCFNAIRDIFTIYGAHLWCLHLKTNWPLSPQDYQRVEQVLGLTPNLKSLSYHVCGRTQIAAAHGAFPHLEHLEHIELGFSTTPASLVRSLIENNNHITQLTVHSLLELRRANLPNLAKLKASVFYYPDDILLLDTPQVNWPLQELSICILFSVNRPQEPERVFELMSRKWGATLKDLTINFQEPEIFEDELEDEDEDCNAIPLSLPSLNLPHVERLTMYFVRYYSWEFITPLQNSLKYLKLGYHGYYVEKDPDKRVADFFKMDEWMQALKSPLEANIIWETYVNLETLECEDSDQLVHEYKELHGRGAETYTRTQWKGLKQRNKETCFCAFVLRIVLIMFIFLQNYFLE